jgi:proton-dependent oligopeptide transporter, POT family
MKATTEKPTTEVLHESDTRGWAGHPSGLSTLFFTEMWERFSYYGMRALLILFMTAPLASGGLGFNAATAGAIYGMYTAMVYMTNLPGGWIADRLIGQRRAILYGGILIASGHFSMAFPTVTTFYLGLALIVIGTGLLKPNISVIVGQLYGPKDQRRDAGFSIFYMGINLGAFLAPLVTGFLAQSPMFRGWLEARGFDPNHAWHWGFGAAGIGMTLGLVQYLWGASKLGDAGLHPVKAPSEREATQLRTRTLAICGAVFLIVAVIGVGMATGALPFTATQLADAAGYMLLVVMVVFFGWLFFGGNWTPAERKRLYVIGVFFLAAALFWSVFEQAGSTLNLFADRSTKLEIFGWSFQSAYFQSLNSLFIIMLAPVFAFLWIRLRSKEPSTPVKFSLGLIGVGAGFAILVPAATLAASGSMVSPFWLIATYLTHTCAELCLSPVGLSAMTKLAPARIVSLMMGVWFLGASAGNYIGGRVGGLYESLPLTSIFGVVGAFGIAAGVLLLLFSGPIKRMMGEVK